MSLSNPQDNTPHPCTRWFEWNGELGNPRYYDKEAEYKDERGNPQKGMNIEMKLPFAFILLDQLAVIKGWCEARKSGITSNEVRDSTTEPFVVKLFKGGIIARGLYQEIKENVTSKSVGGHFTASLYIAFKNREGKLLIGSLQLKGAALKEWSEFRSKNRTALLEKAVIITGYVAKKKGAIDFRIPVFNLNEISAETLREAVNLDKEVQKYLDGYLKRTRVEQVPSNPQSPSDNNPASPSDNPQDSAPPINLPPGDVAPPPEDDVPF